jgi:hypothetical protein
MLTHLPFYHRKMDRGNEFKIRWISSIDRRELRSAGSDLVMNAAAPKAAALAHGLSANAVREKGFRANIMLNMILSLGSRHSHQ